MYVSLQVAANVYTNCSSFNIYIYIFLHLYYGNGIISIFFICIWFERNHELG